MYTSILKDWVGSNMAGEFRLRGLVFGDAKKRFEDGQLVTTSPVDFIEDTFVGKVAVTRTGTRYLLVG